MKNTLDNTWGVVQRMHIEADTYTSILAGCSIACVEHTTAKYFKESNTECGNKLELLWYKEYDSLELPFELTTPTEIAIFVRQWLEKRAVYPKEQPDTDGDCSEGFTLSTGYSGILISVEPTWIVYGK